jgi:hypothetical protein
MDNKDFADFLKFRSFIFSLWESCLYYQTILLITIIIAVFVLLNICCIFYEYLLLKFEMLLCIVRFTFFYAYIWLNA